MESAAAFGFRWAGIEGPVPTDDSFERWPEVLVSHGDTRPLVADEVSGDRARLIARGGSISLSRRPRRVVLEMPGPVSADELLKLHVARMAATFTVWDGRIGLQAGTVRQGDKALAVAGPTRAGKTTLLEAFARAGGTVFCDELAALEGGRVLAGTPFLQLRPDALSGLGPAPRPTLEAGPSSAGLGGLVHLAWGDQTELIPLGTADRMSALIEARVAGDSIELPPELLDLVSLPAWRFVRPRDWQEQPRAVEMLFDALETIG